MLIIQTHIKHVASDCLNTLRLQKFKLVKVIHNSQKLPLLPLNYSKGLDSDFDRNFTIELLT